MGTPVGRESEGSSVTAGMETSRSRPIMVLFNEGPIEGKGRQVSTETEA